MPGKVLLLFPAFLLLGCLGLIRAGAPPGDPLDDYHKANRFFNSAVPTDITDSLALDGFQSLIRSLQTKNDPQYDTLLFQAFLKKGILLDVKNNNEAAKSAYLQAVSLCQRRHSISDSLLFRPYVYAGTNYFNLNNFDSANYYLIKAEALVKRFPHLPETERLYNTLGALHYVNGNYLQSNNYFYQALEFVKTKHPYDRIFAIGLQANIATSYYKQGRYRESLEIYHQILREKIPAGYIYNGIRMNMGKAYAGMNQQQQALACFRKVNTAETPGVLNELALSWLALKQNDSGRYYLDRLTALKKRDNLNMLDIGINHLYRGDMLVAQGAFAQALYEFQQSISIFSGNFNNNDIYSNPGNFTGSYTYYRLFEALYKKARTFELLFQKTKRAHYLAASLDAYKAALTLLSFIEKSYDTDDAKLFLKNKSQDIYDNALTVCLQLQQLNPEKYYLEQAFMISEQNKASVLAASVRRRHAAQLTGMDPSFSQAERNIRFAIARLDINSEKARNSGEIRRFAAEKARYEIELSRLQKSMEQDDRFFRLKYGDDDQSVANVRKQLNQHQAVFSFFRSKRELHVFAFTNSSFTYGRIDSTAALQQEIGGWLKLLKNSADGKKFTDQGLGQQLYRLLIKPLQSLAPGKDEWIIIPDGDICLLPFESLPDGNTGKRMLETTTISYQFSSHFMTADQKNTGKYTGDEQVLSFAPFAERGAGYRDSGFAFIGPLKASGDEIAALKGSSLTDSTATKLAFLQRAPGFHILHLATHAMANVQNAAGSFIAFFPEKKQPAENCLYLEEIYGLNLNDCEMVVISACETGDGAIVNSEGVMSLGRAFAYAGADAVVNSLWKADDKATAEILKKFYEYLANGDTKPKALQKAKLDYLNGDALYKSPAYWSNLVLTGSAKPVYRNSHRVRTTAIFFAVIILVCMGGIAFARRKKEKKVDAFQQTGVI